ncbi:MAG: hypothetical protein GY789_27850 [Hyphomicrobiales bacterium]|nr:hypothetical protein [Hyphomicrobiales bacterium]
MFSKNKLMVIFLSTAMAGMAAKGALFPNAAYAARSVDEAKPGNNRPVAEKRVEVGFDSETTVAGNATPDHVKQVNAPLPRNIPRSVGTFQRYDLRKRTDGKFLAHAPGRASNDRISFALHGDNKHIKGAVDFAADQFAKRVHDVSGLLLKDNDVDPSTSTLSVWADGRRFVFPVADDTDDSYNPLEMKLSAGMSQTDIAIKVYKAMEGAYNEHILPRLVAGDEEEVEKQAEK